MSKRKNKGMANCISKINKDHFFAFEEFMKNDILFLKGKARLVLDMGTRGTNMGVHSIRKLQEIMTLAPLQTGVW